MFYLMVVLGVVSLVAATLTYTGKALDYIEGWKQTSEAEKAKIDIKGLCRNVSCVIIIMTIICFSAAFIEGFQENYLTYALLIWSLIVIADVVYISILNKYKK